MVGLRTRGSRAWLATLTGCILASGCIQSDRELLPVRDNDVRYYKDVSTAVEYPSIVTQTPDEVISSQEPHTLKTRQKDEIWDLSLPEAMQIGLRNNPVLRSAGQFLSPANALYTNPDRIASVYDPSIQETGVLFGGRGVEAALADFDANLLSGITWGRNDTPLNALNPAAAFPKATELTSETANFDVGITKQFASGGLFAVTHNVNYLWNNQPTTLFPSNYTGSLVASYRHPLWAGAGTEYTRTAGPITRSFGGISGVSQGVVISRINNDISIADFENSVRNLVKDIEDTYWDLYLAYRNYDTAVINHNSSLTTWRQLKDKLDAGGIRNFRLSDEAQSRDQLFATQAVMENSLSQLYTAETRLRRLLGLPVNDGKILRPADEPVTAELILDWPTSLAESLTYRPELRRQKWNIKSLDLQLRAAKSLTKPRLDFVGGYGVNGFGDKLISQTDADIYGTSQGLNNFYGTLLGGNYTGWNLGFEMNMPFGFRSAHAQVRNYELRLAKAQKVLELQEMEISHELANSFQELARTYATALSQFNRRKAAIENVDLFEKQQSVGVITVDEVLRAQVRLADAENAFSAAVVDYNKSLTNLLWRKGTLLQQYNIQILESSWEPEAYDTAYRRAYARSNGYPNDHVHTEPEEFATPAPMPANIGLPATAQPTQEIAPAAPPEAPEPEAPVTDGNEQIPPSKSESVSATVRRLLSPVVVTRKPEENLEPAERKGKIAPVAHETTERSSTPLARKRIADTDADRLD